MANDLNTLAGINTEITEVQAKINTAMTAMNSASNTAVNDHSIGDVTINKSDASLVLERKIRAYRLYLQQLIEMRDSFPVESVVHLEDHFDNVIGEDQGDYLGDVTT